jgi:hypothetical protein
MAVLKKSLAMAPAANDSEEAPKPKRAKAKGDTRQQSMLLPVKGGGGQKATTATADEKPSRRKKAG